jgi:hypothetical protein
VVHTTSAVRALVISPCTWITPSIGAIGCKSIATMRGSFSSLHIMIQQGITDIDRNRDNTCDLLKESYWKAKDHLLNIKIQHKEERRNQ